MSKGIQYSGTDDTRIPKNIRRSFDHKIAIKRATEEDFIAWIEAENTRWAIVDKCVECGDDLIAEERLAHRIAHLPPAVRVIVRQLRNMPAKSRVEALAAVRLFDEEGATFNGLEV